MSNLPFMAHLAVKPCQALVKCACLSVLMRVGRLKMECAITTAVVIATNRRGGHVKQQSMKPAKG